MYFYYELDNFYQNHRRYVKSRSDGQLLGNLDDVGDCDVFKRQNKSDPKSKVIAPCGALANSMFNGWLLVIFDLFLYAAAYLYAFSPYSRHFQAVSK